MRSDHHSHKLSLYLRHRAALIDYATPIAGDRMLAEDAVQDAWVRFSDTGRHDVGARLILRPVGYLYRIVRNVAIDMARHRRTEYAARDDEAGAVSDPAAPADRRIEARETLTALQKALAELPERQRLAFDMHRMQHMTYQQIGAALKISQTRAHELVRAALEHCMARLMDEGHL